MYSRFLGVVPASQWRSQYFKVGGTPVTWPEGPMRGGVLGRGSARAPPHQLGGLGRDVTTPPPPPEKISDLHESCGHACLSTAGGVPPVPPPPWLRYCCLCSLHLGDCSASTSTWVTWLHRCRDLQVLTSTALRRPTRTTDSGNQPKVGHELWVDKQQNDPSLSCQNDDRHCWPTM